MISIALASYNGAKYIRDQLDSILAQTYQNFELIICDDCSTDDTWWILEEYAQKDNRIKIYKNERNLGFKKNFEKAILLCQGEYVATSDQDDIWMPNHLQILIESIKEDVASAGEALLIDSEGYSLRRFLTNDVSGYKVDVSSTRKLSHLFFRNNPFSGAVCLFKKEVFDVALPVPDKVRFQDTWFTACALCLGNLNYNKTVITEHRIHGNNASGNQKKTFFQKIKNTFTEQFNTDRVDLCKELLKRFPEISAEKKSAISFAETWLQARIDFQKRKAITMLIKNYKNMYSSVSRIQILLSCCKILIRN